MIMNLYLISQDVNKDYDTYDSAVVSANSNKEARMIHPGGYKNWSDTWCDPKDVSVKKIGLYNGKTETVICASFNAG